MKYNYTISIFLFLTWNTEINRYNWVKLLHSKKTQGTSHLYSAVDLTCHLKKKLFI